MKKRLDKLLVERGFFESRSRAAAAVLGGSVKVEGKPVTKAGAPVESGAEIEVEPGLQYVSRGGLKLEHAFRSFPISVYGLTVIDAGASTGGFSDCLLKHGAARVIAVDVGYGQLDWKLRQDPRVTVLERTNIRELKPEALGAKADFAVFDLSFISLKKAIPAVIKCLRPRFEAVALIKPQFEAGRGKVGKGGVVRDKETHRRVLLQIWDFVSAAGFTVLGLTDSSVPGPKGNVEFLMHFADRGHATDNKTHREEAVAELLDRIHGGAEPA